MVGNRKDIFVSRHWLVRHYRSHRWFITDRKKERKKEGEEKKKKALPVAPQLKQNVSLKFVGKASVTRLGLSNHVYESDQQH